MIYKGTIEDFSGSHMSGLATMVIRGEDGVSQAVPCDNAHTVRALEGAFGGVIGPGHTFNRDAIVGEEIYWGWDEFGLTLGGFTPVDQASPELVEAYGESTEE